MTDSLVELADYPSRTLYTTWNLSFAQIDQQSPHAAHLLRFLAYLDHQDIWFQLLGKGLGVNQPAWFTAIAGDEFAFEDAMHVLTQYCLVEAHHQTGTYSLHTCVHDWTLNGLNQQIDEVQYWLAFDCVARHISWDDWDYLWAVQYQRFTGHVMRLLHDRFEAAATQIESVRTRFNSIGRLSRLLMEQVHYYSAVQMYTRLLEGQEEALGPDHISTLDTFNCLGILYHRQGKLVQAEKMFIQALQGQEEALGPDHTSTLDTLNNLGTLYGEQGKLVEAEKIFIQALRGKAKELGPDHTSTLNTISNLGILYRRQGKLIEAEKMFIQALQGYEKALGPDHTLTLRMVNQLGILYRRQDKLVEAEKMFIQALQGYEKAVGAERMPLHPPALNAMIYYGHIYSQTNRKQLAKEMYTRALSGYTAIQGPSSKVCSQLEADLQALQLPASSGPD